MPTKQSRPASDEPAASAHSVAADAATQVRLAELFQKFHKTLLKFLERTLTPQEAQEVAQETYVKVLSLGNTDKISSYLWFFVLRVAKNLSKNRRKQLKTRKRIDDQVLFVLFDKGEYPDPRDAIEGQQSLSLLADAVRAMPPKCRLVFTMSRIDQLENAQIAAVMGVHERTVKRLLARALEHCHEAIEEARLSANHDVTDDEFEWQDGATE